jgi:hypothetical protein
VNLWHVIVVLLPLSYMAQCRCEGDLVWQSAVEESCAPHTQPHTCSRCEQAVPLLCTVSRQCIRRRTHGTRFHVAMVRVCTMCGYRHARCAEETCATQRPSHGWGRVGVWASNCREWRVERVTRHHVDTPWSHSQLRPRVDERGQQEAQLLVMPPRPSDVHALRPFDACGCVRACPCVLDG